MQKTARNSLFTLALATVVALLASPAAHASSASSHFDNAWSHSPATTFDWSFDHFDLKTKSHFGSLSLQRQITFLFLALDFAWLHAGGDRSTLEEIWMSSWTQVTHDEPKWHHGFDEWTHHHHVEVCPAPTDPDGPTIPEPLFYSAMMGTGVGGLALLRGWRRRGRSLRQAVGVLKRRRM
jgi:hypothetical protein